MVKLLHNIKSDLFEQCEHRKMLSTHLHPSCCLPRYRVVVPVSFILSCLSFSKEEWKTFSGPLGLTYQDREKTLLDCKASMAALPLPGKAAAPPTGK